MSAKAFLLLYCAAQPSVHSYTSSIFTHLFSNTSMALFSKVIAKSASLLVSSLINANYDMFNLKFFIFLLFYVVAYHGMHCNLVSVKEPRLYFTLKDTPFSLKYYTIATEPALSLKTQIPVNAICPEDVLWILLHIFL